MWRSFFLGVGISLCILGGEGLVFDKAILRGDQTVLRPSQPTAVSQSAPREVTMPEWAPWSFLSSGAVIILYSITLARGSGG